MSDTKITNEPTEENTGSVADKVSKSEKLEVKESSVSETPRTEVPRKNKAALISVLLVTAILLVLGAGVGGMYLQKNFHTATTPLTPANDGNTTITQEESTIASVAEKVNPSVVSIVGTTERPSYFAAGRSAAGTGIIVSSDGYVMTNSHVVKDTTDISVVDHDGTQYDDVTYVGSDPLNDIAFLKISSNKTFTPAELGNSSTLRIGQQVVAIGNALGQYSNTVTSGIVSGTGRPVTAGSDNGDTETLTDLIQTDASINPGNSGGPLLNMSGQVIGINTAIVEDANGIGFAIPINSTKGVLAGVLANGKVPRAYLGVLYTTVSPDVAKQYNLSVKEGAYIYTERGTAVAAGSPAAAAGLKSGDIIVKVGDTTIGKAGGLSSIVGMYKPGDTVTVTYIRGGQTHTTEVTFTEYRG